MKTYFITHFVKLKSGKIIYLKLIKNTDYVDSNYYVKIVIKCSEILLGFNFSHKNDVYIYILKFQMFYDF